MTTKLGFVGLGIMVGYGINLRKAGHAVWVHARPCRKHAAIERAERPPAFAARGCGQRRHYFHLRVGYTDVEHVLLGDQGLIHGVRKVQCVDMSTISPWPRVARRGIGQARREMLDAPVSA